MCIRVLRISVVPMGCFFIGASLSELHTSVTSLHSACVCLLACLDLALTVNFKSADFACMCAIIFKQSTCTVAVRRTMVTTKTETTHGPTYSLAKSVSEP